MVSSFYENIYNDNNKCLLAVKNNNNIIGYLYGYVCENNVKIIELKVCNNNTSAIKLYKSEGFTEFKTIMRVKI